MLDPKFPGIEVRLTGHNSNPYFIVGTVKNALKQGKRDGQGVTREDIDAFVEDATSGDYDHLLQTCMRYVTVT